MLALARGLDVDPLVGGEAADQRDPGLLGREELDGGCYAEPLRHDAVAELAAAEAAKPAIAAGGPPADRPGFEHHGLDPMLPGQMVGSRQAGIAAADDRDLGREVAGQRRHACRLGPPVASQ